MVVVVVVFQGTRVHFAKHCWFGHIVLASERALQMSIRVLVKSGTSSLSNQVAKQKVRSTSCGLIVAWITKSDLYEQPMRCGVGQCLLESSIRGEKTKEPPTLGICLLESVHYQLVSIGSLIKSFRCCYYFARLVLVTSRLISRTNGQCVQQTITQRPAKTSCDRPITSTRSSLL